MQIKDKLNYYKTKGKPRLVLETIIIYTNEFQVNEAKIIEHRQTALFFLNKLTSLESKLLKGIISFQDYELSESKIILGVIKLSDRFLEDIEFKDDSAKPQKGNYNYNIVGKWKTEYYDKFIKAARKLIWDIEESGISKETYFDIETNQITTDTPEMKWEFQNNILSTIRLDGKINKDRIEWIDNNSFFLTVLDGGEHEHVNGTKFIYERI